MFLQVAQRSDTFCNYLEGCAAEFGDATKIIYRHYATLYFIFAVDQQESDLGILDLIQVFVESLDQCFESVCELDLIFHSDKVHYIVDEIIMAGMVLETNLNNIVTAINEQNKLVSNSTIKPTIPQINVGSSLSMGNSLLTSTAESAGKLLSSISSSISQR